MKSDKKLKIAVVVLFVFLGFLVYSNMLLNEIFLFDDFEYVIGNPIIQDFSYFNLSDPRQVGYMSFALNYAIDGENPSGYHLFNVIIHVSNAAVVFFLIIVLFDIVSPEDSESKKWHAAAAFLSGLIFLVHPIETQAVSYITQRFTSLCTLFYLLSVLLYLMARVRLEKAQSHNTAYALYALSILNAVLAMKTKEIAFTIPFTIAVLEFLLFKSSVFSKRRFIFLIPYMATLVIIPLSLIGPEWGLIKPGEGIAEVVRKDKLYDLYERSPLVYLFTQFRVIVTYIGLLILPVNQKAVYDFKVSHSFFELKVLLSLGLLLLIMGYAVYLWRKAAGADADDASDYKLVSIGIIWFFITLSIESSIIPIKDVIFEHRVYLPSAGFFASCSVLLLRLVRKIRVGVSDFVKIGILALIIGIPLATGAYIRNEVWTDELKFWDDVVKKSPNKAIGYNNRGNAYGKLRQYELALRDIDRTIASFPKNPGAKLAWEDSDFTPTNMAKTFMNRGQIYIALGDIVRAKADFNRAKQVMIMPLDSDNTLKQGDMYAKHGSYERAIEEYNKILAWDPQNINALNNRGNAYSRSNHYKEAIDDFDNVISLDPSFVLAYHNRGIAYAWSGDMTKATEDFKRACEMGFKPACDSIDIVARQKGTNK